MSAFPQCDASLAAAQASGDPWGYCAVVHCDDYVSYEHQFCYCQGQFNRPPYITPGGACINGAGSLIPIASPGCYCCCSCFAYDTPIAVTETTVRPVQDFAINDPVLVAEDASLQNWIQKPVLFSSGTGAHGKNKLIKIHFGDQTTGITLTPTSFVSGFVTEEQSASYYQILSTKPNDFIDQNGLVNLQMVKSSNVDAIAELLGTTVVVAQMIFDLLSADSNYLLATGIQPFLMKDKTLKQAHKLVPGVDVLVRDDGSTTPIISLEVGMFERGVHHIATSNEPAKSMDGHLMLANGIVVGDYSAQLSLASSTGALEDVHESAPTFGTKEYNDLHTHLAVATPFSAHAGAPARHKVDSFKAHNPDKSVFIPKGAFSFITKLQAEELLHHGPIFPASKSVAEPDVRYLFRLFGAFYPDITFFYDQNNMMPNVYAFNEYDRKFVVVTVGWTLVEGVYFQGIAMAIANVVNALNQTSVPAGVSPTGQADYDIYPDFLSLFYRPADAVKNYNLGLDQIKKVFGYIEKHKKQHGKLSLSCRIQTLEASIGGLPLPHCAGGPPDPALEVVEASAEISSTSEFPVVTVRFNLPVDPATATAVGNYLIDPSATAFSATIDDSDPNTVHLVAEILPDTEYLIVATGVLSVDKQPVILGKNSGKFVLKGSA